MGGYLESEYRLQLRHLGFPELPPVICKMGIIPASQGYRVVELMKSS